MLLAVPSAQAVLLEVDLGVENQITITATSGLSSATVSGSDTTGIYLDDFFGAIQSGISHTLVSGDLTSANQTSDGSPDLFASSFSSGVGLNVWSFTDDSPTMFTVGSLAFTGQATWTVDAGAYANAFNNVASGGDIYFPADTFDDLSGATVIGQWTRAGSSVPEYSSSLTLFALGLFGLGFFRKFKA